MNHVVVNRIHNRILFNEIHLKQPKPLIISGAILGQFTADINLIFDRTGARTSTVMKGP
jgi:hypothetical protein